MFTTDQKGAIAETAIVHTATKLGIDVYRPVGEGGRYDMIFDLDKPTRVQCKWAPLHGEVVVVRCYSSRRTRGGLLKRVYEQGEIDAIAAYCPELDRSFYLPFEEFGRRTQFQLRLGPTKNNQRQRLNWAEDFDFAARLQRLGAVAQLGERRRGTPKVTGSSPVGSITPQGAT